MKTFALDDESSRWIKNHSYITVMRIRCRDINLVNVWLWENFVLPNVRTDVVQSQKMSNKLKIILSEEERTRSIYRFSEDTTTFECMKGDIWENPSRDGENVKNATKFNQSQLSKKKQHWHIFLLRMRRIMFIFWARVFLWRAGFDSFNQSSWVKDIWSNQRFDFSL